MARKLLRLLLGAGLLWGGVELWTRLTKTIAGAFAATAPADFGFGR